MADDFNIDVAALGNALKQAAEAQREWEENRRRLPRGRWKRHLATLENLIEWCRQRGAFDRINRNVRISTTD